MKKMTTLFMKDPQDLGRVIKQIDPENEWALTNGIATVKFDGTACAIINGELYKRYDAKRGKKAPEGAIPCQEADEHGHHPHWIKVTPQDKYYLEGFENLVDKLDGTYELCGPKINGNKERLYQHILLKHGLVQISLHGYALDYDGIRMFLENRDIEGIVFHEKNGDRMCKIRRRDFGFKW